MKAKLIKTDKDNYILVDSTKGVYDKGYLIGSSRETDVPRLSKQNCDELFGIVDVEKIADRHTFGQRNHEWKAYIKGFSKAIELNKDKVFTEEQMFRMFLFGHSLSEAIKRGVIEDKPMGEIFNDRIQSLQQPTEIEVTFNPEDKDSDGCLILKKI